MLSFRQYIQESSLRDQLTVPQNPIHHSEGNVARHSLLVHSAMNQALKMLKQKKEEHPDGPFANLNLDLSEEDLKLLRLSALLHDIGKGTALDPVKLSAYGHQDPDMFEPAMKKLGPVWYAMLKKASPKDKEDLWFIIQNHMSMDDETGMPKSLWRKLVDDQGKFKNERKIKLLLAIFLMDRMGRGGGPRTRSDAKAFVKSNTGPGVEGLGGIYKTSDTAKKQLDFERSRITPPAPDSPQEFIAALRKRGLPDSTIKKALKGKRPDLTDIDSFF